MNDEQLLKKEADNIAGALSQNSNSSQNIPKDTLSEVQERLQKLKAANDAVEQEMLRQEELKAKLRLGGNALAGQPEKTPNELADEEAKRLISIWR